MGRSWKAALRGSTVFVVSAAAVAGGMLMLSPASSALPASGTCEGNIAVANASTGAALGYIGTELSAGRYSVTTTPANYLQVSFVPGAQQNIVALNGSLAGTANQNLDLQAGFLGDTFASGAPDFAWLVGGSATAPGGAPSTSGTATGGPTASYPIESAVWNTSSLGTLTQTWINPDSTGAPTTSYLDASVPNLGATGDLTALHTAHPDTYVPVTYTFVGSCNLPTTTTLVATTTGSGVNRTSTFTATVNHTLGTPYPTGTVTFYDNGHAVGTVPLVNGQASLTLASPIRHSVVAVYNGDNYYAPSSASNTVTTTTSCRATYTGAQPQVNITSGIACIADATVSGNVNVARGAGVDIESSTVNGSVQASRPTAVRICGTTITGNVVVDGATGPVIIGDPANGCAANTIEGRIYVVNGSGPVTIIGNTVEGPITTTGDTGRLTIRGNHT